MKLAFVDLFFSWPPHGGADVDVYNTAIQLQALGHDVRVFVSGCEEYWERGAVDPAQMPFPTTRLEFTVRQLNRHEMPRRFREAVDAWRPDVVFVCDGFFLKPYVSDALAHYPTVCRYYAHELACPRDLHLFRDGAPCPMNYLETPDKCRRCSLEGVRDEIKHWRFLSWTQEYLAGRAYMPQFHARLVRSLALFNAIIVYNPLHLKRLEKFHSRVLVVPGGVNISDFRYVPASERVGRESFPAHTKNRTRKVILMSGRVEDPMKGMQSLYDAGECLARTRSDFEIRVTHTDYKLENDWFKPIGWHSHDSIMRFYEEADICVVPSIWEEPFGMVAVEAMASGRPVCATRTGGLQDIVTHGETGFLFERGDSVALAGYLGQLLNDDALRAKMGEAARRRAETEYDWKRIAEKYYPPLLESLVRK